MDDKNINSFENKKTVYNQELSDESKKFLSKLELEAQKLAEQIDSLDFEEPDNDNEPIQNAKTTDFDNADRLEAEVLLRQIEKENN